MILRNMIYKVALLIMIITSSIMMLFPIYWLIKGSFEPDTDLIKMPPYFIPIHFVTYAYSYVIKDLRFLIYVRNSLFVAFSTIAISIPISLLGGYSLARFNYPGKRFITNFALFSYTIPQILLVIPFYQLLVSIKLYNSLFGLIIAHALYATPFCLLLLASFIETIPKEIEESALIDGASVLQVIFRIILPLSLPGIATAAIYTFLLSWNDFAFALVIITSDKIQTVPLAINRIFSGEEAWWGPLLASSTIATIPVLIIFLIFERYLVSGLTLGAVKR